MKGKPAEALTPQQYLAAAQRRSPPIPTPGIQQDCGQRLYSRLEQRLPADIRELFTAGTVAIGELGILTPDAFADFVPPAGYAIQIHAGLPRFLYRVSRALHTRMRVFSDPGGREVQEPTTAVEETVAIMEMVFRNFMTKHKIAGPSDYKISREQIENASALSTHAETFAVAHEIGHVVLWRKHGGVPEAFSYQQELDADRLALTFILGVAAEPSAMSDLSARMAYAGAEFALRVYAGLEHLGYKFKESHPLPGKRLEEIRRMASGLTGGRRGFMKLSTIAFAYDQLLEEVERRLAGPQAAARFVVGVTPERVLSILSVLIEEYVKRIVSADFVVDEATKYFAEIPEDIMRKTAREATLMYLMDPLVNPTKEQIEFAQHEREMFKKTIQLLPQPWRHVFAEVASTLTEGK
ncbi:MAG TPA: hypothetical protein ACFYD6_09695 [Candidatus Brocadiia bacterium]